MRLFSIVLALSMTFTTITVPAEQLINSTQTQNIKQYNVQSAYTQNSNDNWYGLTIEQKLQDMKYLYQTLQQNYPYIKMLKRMYGVDLEQEYQKAVKEIKNSKTDFEFYAIVNHFTNQSHMVGHLSTISPFDYDWFVKSYGDTTGVPEFYWEQMEKIRKVYADEKAKKAYTTLKKKMLPLTQKNTDLQQHQNKKSNVETKIIEKGKIAYIYVDSFDMGYYEEDKKKLFDFYKQVQNYDNVIFDFTENSGGGMFYFNDLIVAPNIDKILYTKVYELMQSGEYNMQFLGQDGFETIEKLPKLSKINQDDLKELDLMLESTYFIQPSQKQKMLKGKLWILVNENVFSSSEYAAMFSKATGFATLVGERTGGDGIGSDPLPILLPNSGIIVRYSPIYGTTADGTNSQEFGTEPDIWVQKGKTYLQTCIDEIKKQK